MSIRNYFFLFPCASSLFSFPPVYILNIFLSIIYYLHFHFTYRIQKLLLPNNNKESLHQVFFFLKRLRLFSLQDFNLVFTYFLSYNDCLSSSSIILRGSYSKSIHICLVIIYHWLQRICVGSVENVLRNHLICGNLMIMV